MSKLNDNGKEAVYTKARDQAKAIFVDERVDADLWLAVS